MHLPIHRPRKLRAVLPSLLAFVALPADGEVRLVTDINQVPAGLSSRPGGLTRFGDLALFSANAPSLGWELWKTDGTTAGTEMVKDLRPGDQSSVPNDFVVVGNVAYFRADDGATGQELWVTDGTAAGTRLVSDVRPGRDSGVVDLLFPGDGVVYFFGRDPAVGGGIWKSDGTAAGTSFVAEGGDLVAGSTIAQLGPNLLYRRTAPGTGSELWISDGTPGGTTLLKDIEPGDASSLPNFLTVAGNQAFFVARTAQFGAELWVTDGTAAGTRLVKDIIPGEGSPSIGSFMVFDGEVYFRATDPTGDRGLWKSDGTEANTIKLSTVDPGNPVQGAVFAGELYFRGSASPGGVELWKTDGTIEGTQLVKDLHPTGNGDPSFLTAVGNQLFFVAADSSTISNRRQLWVSDGTTSGTRIAAIINDSGSPDIADLIALGGQLLFTGTHPERGNELWKSDGTVAGTEILKDIASANGSGSISWLTAVGDEVYFYAHDGSTAGLWKSDGTEAGTIALAPIASDTSHIVPVGDLVFFEGNDGVNGEELWKTDGTPGGTMMVKDISPGRQNGGLDTPVEWDGKLLFRASYPSSASPFVISDGTEAGTRPLFESPFPGIVSFRDVGAPLVIGDIFYFVADDGINGQEPWRSDGTIAGTRILKDLNLTDSSLGSSQPQDLTAVGDTLFLKANGAELWKSDGTEAGTVLVRDIRPNTGLLDFFSPVAAGDRLFFVPDDGIHGVEPWVSDGTFDGTTLLRDIMPESRGSSPSGMVAVGDSVYFVANEPTTGWELWKSDGSFEGTIRVADPNQGPSSSFDSPVQLLVVGELIYFRALHPVLGAELWEHDTRNGATRLVADLVPGSGGSQPRDFVWAGDQLFFTAESPETGRELYVYPLPPNQAPTFSGYNVGSTPGREITISLAKLLTGGAGDPDGDRFRVSIAGGSLAGATVTLEGPAIVYVPRAGFTGMDTFTVELTDSRGATRTGTVTVSVFDPESGPGAVNTPRVMSLPNGDVLIRFQGIPGRSYRLDRSTNMMTWEEISAFVAGRFGEIVHVDTEAPAGVGFYRFVEP